MRTSPLCQTFLALSLFVTSCLGFPSGLPDGFTATDVVKNLGISTSDFCFLDQYRVIVVQKLGRVLMVKNGQVLPQPALDLGAKVGPAFGDRGVITCATDPGFGKTNNYVYIGYVYDGDFAHAASMDDTLLPRLRARMEEARLSGQSFDKRQEGSDMAFAGPKVSRLSRFVLNGDVLDPASEYIVIGHCTRNNGNWFGPDCLPMNGTTHSLDQIFAGPDGNLWATVGDGITFEGSDWTGRRDWAGPMDPDFLPGKMLRMDWMGRGLPDNPWYDGNPDSSRSKVWAVGLRNPFRGSFVPGSTGYDFLVGEVGWYTRESIKLVRRGKNMGWPCYEGAQVVPFPNSNYAACQNFMAGKTDWVPYEDQNTPIQWVHSGQTSAALGGTFFSNKYPAPWAGKYVYADFSQQWLASIGWDVPNSRPVGQPQTFARTADSPVTIKNGPDGIMYYLAQCNSCGGGGVLRAFTYGPYTVPWNRDYIQPECPTPPGYAPIPALPNGWQTLTYLSDVIPTAVHLNENGDWGPIALDSSVGGKLDLDGVPMTIGGYRVRKGFGTHTDSEIAIDLNKICYRLTGSVGMDDEAATHGSQVEFTITADDRLVWNSTQVLGEAMRGRAAPLAFDIGGQPGTDTAILGASQLILTARSIKGNKEVSHANWAEPMLYCGPDAPFLPDVKIHFPQDNAKVHIGDRQYFTGSAKAYDGTPIPWQNLRWTVNMVHGQGGGSHIHPALKTYQTSNWGYFDVVAHTNNDQDFVYYEIRVDVCDPNCPSRCNFATSYVRMAEAPPTVEEHIVGVASSS